MRSKSLICEIETICDEVLCGGVCVCVRAYVCARRSIAKWWLEHQPGNCKVPGLMPSHVKLVLLFP